MNAILFNRNFENVFLKRSSDPFEPLNLRVLSFNKESNDGLMQIRWAKRVFTFVFKTIFRTAPSILEPCLAKLKNTRYGDDTFPLLVVPYLSAGVLAYLSQNEMSALDLSGNFYINTDVFLAMRTDKKNGFPEKGGIKNVYTNNTSTIGRALLSEKRRWPSIKSFHRYIEEKGGKISQSTISKALFVLRKDVHIASSNKGHIQVIQPDILLETLAKKYLPPKIIRKIYLKLPPERDHLLDQSFSKWSRTGLSSVFRYTNLFEDPWAIYVEGVNEKVYEYEDERFYNCVAFEVKAPFIWFDQRGSYSSPVQAYLELAQLDKRERELSETIAAEILSPLGDAK